MPNAAASTADLASIALDARRVRIDPHKLRFHRSRVEPSAPDELKARNERRLALADSWLEQPINDIVVRDGDYAIGDGNERVAGLLLRGVTEITVALLPAETPDSKLDEISLLTDFHKTTLRPFERATVAGRLLDSTGMKKGELAARLRIDQGYLTRLLSLHDCCREVIEAAERDELGPSDWYAISKSPDQLETLRLKLGGATRDELAASVKRSKQPETDAVKVPVIKMAMSGGRGIVIRGGVNLETAREMLSAATKLVDKAISDGLSAKSAAAFWKDSSKKEKPARKKRVQA